MAKAKVLVLGGGVGGTFAANKLAKHSDEMCFVEAGEGKATVLRFNYDHPPQPPKPSCVFKMLKTLMNRFYPVTIPKGITPDVFLVTFRGALC